MENQESNQPVQPKKEDKRKLTALENLRRGREKLQAMKKAGIVPQKKVKPVQQFQVQSESDSESETESETESESEEEVYTLAKKKPVKMQKAKKHITDSMLPAKGVEKQRTRRLEQEMTEMRSLIQQIALAKQKKKPKKEKKQTVIQVMPTPVITGGSKPKNNDDLLEIMKRQMMGN